MFPYEMMNLLDAGTFNSHLIFDECTSYLTVCKEFAFICEFFEYRSE